MVILPSITGFTGELVSYDEIVFSIFPDNKQPYTTCEPGSLSPTCVGSGYWLLIGFCQGSS